MKYWEMGMNIMVILKIIASMVLVNIDGKVELIFMVVLLME